MQKIKDLFQSMESRQGSYSIGVIGIVIGIVVVCNLIIGKLPEQMRTIDISDDKIYHITDTSKDMVKGLEKKVMIRIVGEKNGVDERISTFVNKYAELSKQISVEWVDPVLHPSALETYDTEANSLVVSCEETDKMTAIPFSDIIVYDQSSYYTTGSVSESEFDAEGQITSAIHYVTNNVSKKIYYTAGHGESSFSVTVNDLLEKSNLTTEELNLLMAEDVPEDCDLLILNGPATDLAESELAQIKAFMEKGGKVMIMLSAQETKLPNLEAFLTEYGMQKETGYMADTQRNYQGNPYSIFPELSLSGELSDGISSQMVLLVNASGFTEVDPAREGITLSPFMKTSAKGYAVTEEAQKEGTYILGAVAEEEESRLTVFGTNALIEAQITDSFTTLENLTVFMNAVTANFDDVENLSIKAKSLTTQFNAVQHAGAISMLVIFGIPLVSVLVGFGVWWSRRKA